MADSRYPSDWTTVSLQTKIASGFRCVRCGHPNGRWCPSGADPHHAIEALIVSGPLADSPGHIPRVYVIEAGAWIRSHLLPCDEHCTHDPEVYDHRVLTVHHLDGDKTNLAWWNLASLCQRCHLEIQGRVRMEQTYQLPHSDWFCPYVAGFYAFTVNREQLTREEVEGRLAELLTLGQPHLEDHYHERFPQRDAA